MVQPRRVLEVIATSVQDAVAAELGGADRLEVVHDLKAGGLTPSLDLVRQIRRMVVLPMRVILRQQDDFAALGEEEMENVVTAARQFAAAGADGFVLGFARGAHLDIEHTAALLNRLDKPKATFHHAFEEATDKTSAIEELKKCSGIDRILTTGGPGDWQEKAGRLTEYCERALPEITILAGGGLDKAAIQLLLERTPVREFHVGRAVRKPQRVDGVVQSGLVAELATMIHS